MEVPLRDEEFRIRFKQGRLRGGLSPFRGSAILRVTSEGIVVDGRRVWPGWKRALVVIALTPVISALIPLILVEYVWLTAVRELWPKDRVSRIVVQGDKVCLETQDANGKLRSHAFLVDGGKTWFLAEKIRDRLALTVEEGRIGAGTPLIAWVILALFLTGVLTLIVLAACGLL